MERRLRHIYEFGQYRLDTGEHLLLREGQRVSLPPKAFETLVALVERRGRLVEKEELMQAVWPNSFVEEASLTHNVWTLRKTLGSEPGGQSFIETVPKRGYRFTARVLELSCADEELILEKHTLTRTITEEEVLAGNEPAEAVPLIAPGAVAALPDGQRLRGRALPRSTAALLAALLIICAATAFIIYWLISVRQHRASATAAIPFREMSISRLTTSGKITHAAISPDGKYVAYVTVDAEGDSLWVSHVAAPTSVRVAGPAATELVSVTFAPDGDAVYYLTLGRDRGNTALYRVPLLGGPSSMAAYDTGPVGFSPDGRQMAFIRKVDDRSQLIVSDRDGTNERVLASRRQPELFRGYWNAPAWSPDGKTIACQARLNDERGQYETVVGVNIEDGSQVPLNSARWYYTGQPVWLADASGLLLTASESETAPLQVWHIALKGGEATRITHDLNNYHDLSLTKDSKRLMAVQNNSVSSIWVAPEADAGRARQIASDAGWIQEIAWTPDGRIVYRSNAGGNAEIWVMNADGSNQKQLTTGARASRGLSVSPDGRYIFFASDRAGRFNIWRVDADGGNLKQLTTGDDEFYPHSTPDGAWVVYQRGVLEPRLWKVAVDGGEAVQLTQTRAVRPAVSPDGAFIAYHFLDPDKDKSRWRIGVVSSQGGQPIKLFDFPPTVVSRVVRWSPDSQSILYVNNPGGPSDIWVQPLDGGAPKQLTNFKAEQIIAFDWSPDGRTLAYIRGVETSDVVLIGNAAVK